MCKLRYLFKRFCLFICSASIACLLLLISSSSVFTTNPYHHKIKKDETIIITNSKSILTKQPINPINSHQTTNQSNQYIMKLLFSNAALLLAVSSLYLSAFAPIKTVNGHAAMSEPMSRYVVYFACDHSV